MDTESKDIMLERIKKLPKEVRDALASDELSTKIRTVGNNHHLHIDQIGTLEDEVILAIMGISEISELPDQLMEQLSVSKTDADAIVNDINNSVFVPIQNSMKQVGEKSVVMPSSIAKTPATPAPTPAALAPTDMQINAPEAHDAIAAPVVSTVSAPIPKPAAPAPEIDVMFNEPTISIPKKAEGPATATATPAVPNITAKVEPPKPAPIYKADPYREPIE